MSGIEFIEPEALAQLASEISAQVSPLLTQAQQTFDSADIDASKFSTAGTAMGVVYPGVKDWATLNSQRKAQEVTAVVNALNATAQTWSGAEDANTIPPTC